MNAFEESYFKVADMEEHQQILRSEKKVIREKIIGMVVLALIIFVPIAPMTIPMFFMMKTVSIIQMKMILIMLAFVLLFGLYAVFTISRYRCILKQEYRIAEADVIRKFNHANTHDFIRRKIEVNYGGGLQRVSLTTGQALSISRGDKVYLIKLDGTGFTGMRGFAVCKKQWG